MAAYYTRRRSRWTASGIVVGAVLVWAYLLYRMVASSPHSAWHGGGEHCGVTARVIWAPRVVLREGERAAAVHINEDGHIAAAWPCPRDEADEYADVRGLVFEPHGPGVVLSPGVIDAAAHLAEWLDPPGHSYEGFVSGTQAAAAGGVTTVVDLPAHASPLTTSGVRLRRKAEVARQRLHIDVGFWAAALPESLDAETLDGVLQSGALGFAAVVASDPYLEQSGVAVGGARALTLAELETVIDAAARSSKPVLVHSEVVSDDDAGLPAGADGMDYASWLATRPMRWEEGAVRALLAVAAKPRAGPPPRIHVVRLTDAGCMPLLREAAAREAAAGAVASTPEGVELPRVTASTCPHYAMFDAESVVRGDTRLKVAPPLRHAANRQQLWKALLEGSVSCLTSDHTPTTLEERAGSFFEAFSGISGLQFTLAATWTEGREHGATVANLSRWLSEEPAKLAGLWRRKGSLERGKDADLVLWTPDARTETAAVFHRQPGSPYEDLPLKGRTLETIVRGRTVFHDGAPPLAPCGQVVLRAEGSLPARG